MQVVRERRKKKTITWEKVTKSESQESKRNKEERKKRGNTDGAVAKAAHLTRLYRKTFSTTVSFSRASCVPASILVALMPPMKGSILETNSAQKKAVVIFCFPGAEEGHQSPKPDFVLVTPSVVEV